MTCYYTNCILEYIFFINKKVKNSPEEPQINAIIIENNIMKLKYKQIEVKFLKSNLNK